MAKQDSDKRDTRCSNSRDDVTRDDRKPSSRKNSYKRRNGKKSRSGADSTGGPATYGSLANRSNDISWYNKYPTLLSAAASVPFPYKPGMLLELAQNDIYGYAGIPGVCVINWYPSIGYAQQPTDPINITCHEIFGKVRAAYSSDLAADAPDFGVYFLSLDAIFGYIADLKRLYRVLNAYNPNNYSVPDAVLIALGVSVINAETLRANKMQLFAAINELIAMSRKFLCPALMPLFNRHYWMNDNVYTDAPYPNAQLYVFKQVAYFKFALQATPDNVQAGGLQMVSSPIPNVTSVQQLYNFGVSLINALSTWDTSYTISGYLRRAYEGAPTFVVEDLRLEETLVPQYDEVVLSQIENVFPTVGYIPSVVSQDPKTNSLLFKPVVNVENSSNFAAAVALNPMVNCRAEMPTAADVTEATRLHVAYAADATGTTSVSYRIISGTEIPTAVQYFHPVRNTSGGVSWAGPSFSGPVILDADDDDVTQYTEAIQTMAIAAQFDWHPIVPVLFGTSAGSKFALTTNVYVFGDTRNLTAIPGQQLAEINKICLFSQFNAFS